MVGRPAEANRGLCECGSVHDLLASIIPPMTASTSTNAVIIRRYQRTTAVSVPQPAAESRERNRLTARCKYRKPPRTGQRFDPRKRRTAVGKARHVQRSNVIHWCLANPR
jgi:hypothetical protein